MTMWSILMCPPAAFVLVDDFNHRRLAFQIGDIPRVPIEAFGAAGAIVRTGGCANDLAVDKQIDTGLARMGATADEEIDVFARDRKRRRSERAWSRRRRDSTS